MFLHFRFCARNMDHLKVLCYTSWQQRLFWRQNSLQAPCWITPGLGLESDSSLLFPLPHLTAPNCSFLTRKMGQPWVCDEEGWADLQRLLKPEVGLVSWPPRKAEVGHSHAAVGPQLSALTDRVTSCMPFVTGFHNNQLTSSTMITSCLLSLTKWGRYHILRKKTD